MTYDALIVGAGLYGASVARTLLDAGKRVLVLEKRPGIGGNCADMLRDGQLVNLYGGHIFHTSSAVVTQFVTRFAQWRPITHLKLAKNGQRVFSFPINLLTLHQLWGVTNEREAKAAIQKRAIPQEQPLANMETWCLHNLGSELYETFIRGYTTKQWGRSPATLPASIVRRLPVRLDWNPRCFDDTFEAVPVEGYSALIGAMLDGADVRLETDYLKNRVTWDERADVTVYSGPLDALYGHCYGHLAYRSLRFHYDVGASLGAETINHPGMDVEYTRRVDFAAIRREMHAKHVVLTEYPSDEGDPMYPVRDAENSERYNKYAELATAERRLIVGGRLGAYQYRDMHQVIAEGLKTGAALCA